MDKTKQLIRETEKQAIRCLICIERVRNIDAMWQCRQCYSLFHLPCVSQWVRNCKVRFDLADQTPQSSADPLWQWYSTMTSSSQHHLRYHTLSMERELTRQCELCLNG